MLIKNKPCEYWWAELDWWVEDNLDYVEWLASDYMLIEKLTGPEEVALKNYHGLS